MTKKFVTSVANVWAYDSSDVLLFTGKTLLDSSIATTVSTTDIRGGVGNQLLYKFYHTSAMTIKITETQWSLPFLAATLGQTVSSSTNVWTEETVAFTTGTGSVTGTPLAPTTGGTIYGWVTLSTGVVERFTFATKAITLVTNSTYTGNGCVRYFALNAAATWIQVPADILPAQVKLVMDAQLVSADSSTNVIGKVEIIVPIASLSGAFTISMTAGGVSTTPIDAAALASDDLMTGACLDVPVYAQITEILNSVNWYDNVTALAISGGDFGLTAGTTPRVIQVLALAPGVNPFVPPTADLTFSSGTTTNATISAGGSVARIANGTSLLHVLITAKNTIEDSCTVTCS